MKGKRTKCIAAILAGCMMLGGLSGCGTGAKEEKEAVDGNEVSKVDPAVSNSGTVLNIYTSGDELRERMAQLYSNYTDTEPGHGVIGDVKVNWVITPNDDNMYQDKMDKTLEYLTDTDADDRVDLFTVEADYAKKYAGSGYLMTMEEIGLTESDMANQYAYTQDMIKNADGDICGSSWQATPGFFLYRRSIAEEVFGTDDPEEIQEHLKTWEKMDESAAMLESKGYAMFAAYNDTYYPFNANKSIPWVSEDLTIQIDEAMYDWVDQTKLYSDNGYNQRKYEMTDIVTALSKDGKVFGAFAAPWYMDYVTFTCLADPEAAWTYGNGSYGDWAICNGPESFYWGGTWLCVPQGCDNVDLVKDIIYTLTCDEGTMKKLVNEKGEFVNNSKVMQEIADSDYECAFLGGQNHIGLLIDSVEDIDVSNVTVYDQGINDSFKDAMREYYEGRIDKSEAITRFYESAVVKYPELSKGE